jgi:hypothetical protein
LAPRLGKLALFVIIAIPSPGNAALDAQVEKRGTRRVKPGSGLRRPLPQFFLDPVQLSELLNYASHLWRAGSMKLLTGLLAAMLLLAGAGTSHAVVRIANDRGGQIGRYVERYEQLRALVEHLT